jgi:RNA polymerase sigma-70 factor, ECF subfamily
MLATGQPGFADSRPAGLDFRVGLNTAKDMQRKRRMELLDNFAGHENDRSVSPVLAAQEHEDQERLREAVNALRPEEKEVFLLRFNERFTHEAIANRLQIPLGTAKTRLRASLSKLRQALREERPKHESLKTGHQL